MPDSFAQSTLGALYVVNGIDPVLRWDGFTAEMEQAGVPAPTAAITITSGGTGSITGTYYAYIRYVDRLGNFSNLSPISAVATLANKLTITYTSLPVPTDPRVVKRQILRNTDGQTGVFYIDLDTSDLTSTSLSSTKTDTLLAAQGFQSLFDDRNRSLGSINGVPPDDKAVIAAHLDRLFATAEEEYKVGCVAVTAGSKAVTGIGTEWPSNFAGRFLWAEGADQPYEIDSVSESAQTLTLLAPFGGATSPYTTYSIRPSIAQRRVVAFSEPGKADSWAPTNAIALQEDGDEITGLMPKGSFLYILEHEHVYRFTYQDDPLTDGFVFLSIGRGCVNQRSWVVVDDLAYMLDEAGIYSFSGGREVESLSDPIQDLFFTTRSRSRFKVRWEAARWFHACYDRGQQTIRWFVTLSGRRHPRHALCLDLRQKRWWVEEYPFPVGASCTLELDGLERVFLGGAGGEVYLLGEGTLDRVDASKGTVRGIVDSATLLSLTDESASFGNDLVGSVVVIVDGRGKRQRRRIVAVEDTTLRLDRPWLILPDDLSVYQVGGVQWSYRTGWFRWAPGEEESPRRLEICFDPCESLTSLKARIYYDRSKTPVVWDYAYDQDQSNGMSSEPEEPDLTGDLTKTIGQIQRRLNSHKEFYIDGPRFVAVALDGVTNKDEVRILSLSIDGARS